MTRCCPTCFGTKRRSVERTDAVGAFYRVIETCGTCQGTGSVLVVAVSLMNQITIPVIYTEAK